MGYFLGNQFIWIRIIALNIRIVVLIKSNQIIFIGLRSSKDYYKRPGRMFGVYKKGHFGCEFFTWVVGGGALDGYLGEQGLSVDIQECLERFHRECVDYLSRQFVPRWVSPNGEGESATARTTSLLLELVGVVA